MAWNGKRFGEKMQDFKLDEVYALIHKLQPQALIGSNHHLAPNPGEDFKMFEKDLPGKSTKDFATSADDIGDLPFEVCETINGSWGFNLKDRKHKSQKELVQYLVKAAGYGSNLLLNVGPMPNGKIQEEHIESLKKIGAWIRENGQTIYKTKRGPIDPTDEIASTQNGNTVYIHALDSEKLNYFIDGFDVNFKKLTYLNSKQKVSYKKTKKGLSIFLNENEINPVDTILKMEL